MIMKFVNHYILHETPDFGAGFIVSRVQFGISQIINANNAISGETHLSKKSNIKYLLYYIYSYSFESMFNYNIFLFQ